MTIIQAIVMGIVEGLTGFLPVSSTGHLILTAKILNIPDSDFLKSFQVIIQLGAFVPVLILFFNKIIKDTKVIKNVFIAFLPTVIFGLLFYSHIKSMMSSMYVVVISLFIGGVLMILVEYILSKRSKVEIINNSEEIDNKKAFIIGLYQLLSFIPGVSRSGATIIGGLLSGASRINVVEFSFLLALPTIFAASVLDFSNIVSTINRDELFLLFIGFVFSGISAYFCIKLFIKFISHHTFMVFGWYRIFIAIIFFVLIYFYEIK
jgi:undecaprenyl-diphosphatase